ncbi:MAG TPA: preprotein translocase subunit SecG [Actinomycetota bacterium]|nr:preprotein translocase subunit SecG [Actinomycetota bacterium]
MLNNFVLVLHILSCLLLILLVLLHSGKGGGLSDMFGGGNTLSGGTSIERRLDQITVAVGILFGFTSFWLAWKWI